MMDLLFFRYLDKMVHQMHVHELQLNTQQI